jgi:hypothetical protein
MRETDLAGATFMIGISLAVLILIIVGAFAVVAVVLWIGTRDVLGPDIESPKSTQIWKERANRVESARQGLVVVAEGGAASGGSASGGSIVGTPDEVEARKQAALARKAARAAKSAE